ncbi:MAG: cytochrome c [Deltaproteobacteria bacterium]|nr:cytochrome c [Deltaproteobacteria bacterium]
MLVAAACAAPMAVTRIAVDAPESSVISPKRQAELTMMVKHDCGSCHGLTLKGGLGKPLLRERMAALPTETLSALILGGVPGTAMPPWLGIVTPEEARWIAAGLRQGAFE